MPTAVISDIEAASACVNNEARQYDVAIGVEGAGLIWAGFATSGKCGLIYYSLELFLDQHPCYHARRFKAFKRLEHYWHRRALATVVQDPRRAHWLLNSASIQPENHKVIYWPVSVKPCARDDIVPLREKLGIPPFKKTLIYVGNVERRRNIVELCEIAKSFPSDWLLVVHGRWMGDAAYHHQLSQYLNVQQIRFSRDLVPADGLGALIRGCDAGLALYDDVDINHRLTGFASEKVATYFSEAIPIIAYDYPSFTDVCARWKCGVQIACLGRLPDAFRQIISEQIEFREGARAAFRECYDFSAASSEFLEYLKSEDFRTIG